MYGNLLCAFVEQRTHDANDQLIKPNDAQLNEMTTDSEITPRQAAEILNRLQSEERAIAAKLNELKFERHEHKIIIERLEKMNGDRKAYRMIGGVLVEWTVAEVLPALRLKEQNLGDVLKVLAENLKEKKKECAEFLERNDITEIPGISFKKINLKEG
ncbi:Prefoldin subunit 2 [Trichinella pseudospiralis]|uniref:Prefoldin subunit 2 n=2 Tax=Trichinella pseudospiralis TaxID=6337 RepID=A0A0V1IKG0_TRIPS|nr:Prefoldin subunit 2 [Trichinella pseudospiralis]